MYSGQQTDVIEVKPAVKIQSASPTPGIVTAPRSVLQVPMTDNVPTVSGGVSPDVSIVSAGSHGSADEEDKEEDEVQGVLGYTVE